ncbi:MAG TPA: hypothetical protein VN643_06780 [Pyrinomonadaceae bacterium]|nr:hypothetical protein [Pyrinomonadaceae bacterium]
MNNKPIIKVIKKNERLAGPVIPAPQIPTDTQVSTEMAKTVSSWVREFKNRDRVVPPARQKSRRKKAA